MLLFYVVGPSNEFFRKRTDMEAAIEGRTCSWKFTGLAWAVGEIICTFDCGSCFFSKLIGIESPFSYKCEVGVLLWGGICHYVCLV